MGGKTTLAMDRDRDQDQRGTSSTPTATHSPDDTFDAIYTLSVQLDSFVLSDAGRAAAARELEVVVGELRGLYLVMTADEQAILARAEQLLDIGSGRRAPSRGELLMESQEDRLARTSAPVRQTAEDVDRGAPGSTLLADAQANQTPGELLRWALELQSIPRSYGGNYLRQWYVQLRAADERNASAIGQQLADQGIDFGLTAQGFSRVDHVDPTEPAPELAADVARLPMGRSVDSFVRVQYDLAYRPRWSGRLSTILHLTYADGAILDLDFEQISDNSDPAWLLAIGYSYVGPAERVFPLRLDRDTTPRLWAAKQAALQAIEGSNADFEFFVDLSLAGVMSNLPIGPAAVGPEVEVGPITSPRYEPDVAPGSKYETKPMLERYLGEDIDPEALGRLVPYQNDPVTVADRVSIVEGLVYGADGKPLSTSGGEVTTLVNGGIYVMDQNGDIFIASRKPPHFHHSSLLGGDPVAAAGEIRVEAGVIKEITRRSGHYAPSVSNLEQFIGELRARGADLSSAEIEWDLPP